ncbi:MAG: DUF1080 domain-containing protein [Bacteroidota bacterium]
MKKQSCTRILLSVFLLFSITIMPTQAQDDASDYLGKWALYLPGGAGWLNVHEHEGFLDAELLWYGGSVLPVADAYIADGSLVVTRIQEVKGKMDRSHHVTHRLVLHAGFDELVGHAYMPNRNGSGENVVPIKGKRLPALPDAPNVSAARYGDPVDLIGSSTRGWSLIEDDYRNGWSVKDGVLSNNPKQPEGDNYHYRYGNLRTDAKFEDFNLKLEVNIPEGSNSGVYLRGIYEIQVADTYGEDANSHHMGALYSRITPSSTAEKPAGEWQEMDITLYNHHVTVKLNGTTIIDNAPVEGVTGGAMTADEFSAGPIFLQGDHGAVHYRNMVLTPIMN